MQNNRNAFKSSPQHPYFPARALSAARFPIPASHPNLDCLNWPLDALHRQKRASVESRLQGLVGCFLLLFLQVAGVSVLQIAVNIWPKLLQLISKGVNTHLHSPTRETRRKTAIGGGIIKVGNGNRRCVAGKLRNIKHVSTGVSSSDENAVDGVAKAVQA